MKHRLYELLALLSEEHHQTANHLAEKLNVSEKTVRIRLKELNDYLVHFGASIEAKQRQGYRLIISDGNKYLQVRRLPDISNMPETTEERQRFLLRHLLEAESFVKLDDLSERLFVSRNTLSGNIKRVEEIAKLYQLSIERKPKYGIRLRGRERDYRACLVNNLFEYFQEESVEQWLMSLIIAENKKHQVYMSEIALDGFVKYIMVALYRIRKGYVLCDAHQEDEVSQATKKIINSFSDAIEQQYQVALNAYERHFLAVQYSAKLASDSYSQYGPNFIITSKIDELTFKMLTTVHKTLAVDFRNNLELRMSLNQHLVPMDIRLRYQIPVENPLLEQIKREYAYPYTLALTACVCLQEYYQRDIPEAEIAYIALIFALATENRNRNIERKNIILVCVSGKSSSQLFKFKYKQAFGDYINDIYECTIAELETFDFKTHTIDYIFTTVPLSKKYPVPIYEINLFIDANDILVYREMFENSGTRHVLDYFSPNLFVAHLKAETREVAIRELCYLAKRYELIEGEDFYEAVLKREELGQTDFGNLVAIPHPYKVMTENTFVVVAILDKPILWNKKEVQVVFLLSVGTKEDSKLEDFYQNVVNIVFDEQAIRQLIDIPRFETLVSLLT